MSPIPLEVDLLGNLQRARRRARRHGIHASDRAPLVWVPPELRDPTDVATLLVDEGLGYHATELDVLQRQLAHVEAQRAEILAHCPYERDLRTGERLPVAPELGGLDHREALLRARCRREEAALAGLARETLVPRLARWLAARLDMRTLGQDAMYRQADDAPSYRLLTRGYGLLHGAEERRLARRATLMLPDGEDE